MGVFTEDVHHRTHVRATKDGKDPDANMVCLLPSLFHRFHVLVHKEKNRIRLESIIRYSAF